MEIEKDGFIKKKRQYKACRWVEHPNQGFDIYTDDVLVKTPAGNDLHVLGLPIAEAIVQEWNAIEGQITADKLPVTALAATAIDRGKAQRQALSTAWLNDWDFDMLRLYEPQKPALYDQQQRLWQPCIDKVSNIYKIDLPIGTNLTIPALSKPDQARLFHMLNPLNDFARLALYEISQILHSPILAVGLWQGFWTIDQALDCALLEYDVQQQAWGKDEAFCQQRHDLSRLVQQAMLLFS